MAEGVEVWGCQVMRDLCLSGQINCYVADLGAGNKADLGAGNFLHDGFFLQTVSKGT